MISCCEVQLSLKQHCGNMRSFRKAHKELSQYHPPVEPLLLQEMDRAVCIRMQNYTAKKARWREIVRLLTQKTPLKWVFNLMTPNV